MSEDSKRAFLAVILSGVILFGWQFFFAPTPTMTKVQVEKAQEVSEENNVFTNTNNKLEISNTIQKHELGNYVISSNLEIVETKSLNSSKTLSDVFLTKSNKVLLKFEGSSVFQSVNFKFNKSSENEYSLISPKVSGKIKLLKNGFLDISLNSSTPFKIKYQLESKNETSESNIVSSFAVRNNQEFELITVGDSNEESGDLNWFGLDFNYHLFNYLLHEQKEKFAYRTTESNMFEAMSLNNVTSFSYQVFFVEKVYDDLLSFGHNLESAVNFGIWSIIALPILRGLQLFYTYIPNYGIAIILLTILIRLLTFPLQYKSFKSMKKMQVIQPELTKIKEKYADNPQKIQQETMQLFKKAGANPLGGCLPLLAQMPVFFAFYQVLFSAVELVNAPFFLWIHDLSAKDPYYVLPVLMSLAMFLNQKITPMATADPMQKKLMLFMPLVFGLFMKDLPAGLSLYILVSTLVGMLQQLFVFKKTA